ncbi:MAG: dihydropteroate synthase [Thermodesulfobacteriota bacterium]
MISEKEISFLEKGSFLNTRQFPDNKFRLELNGKTLDFSKKTYIMGIVNFTPDSFFDGGKYNSMDKALLKVASLINEGADIIDIGGESTRPGSKSITLNEELERVMPLIEKATKEFDIIFSVDSTKEKVVQEALKSGVSIVNDISGLNFEPKIAKHVAEYNAAIVIMHTSSRPIDMQDRTGYGSLIDDIIDYFRSSINFAVKSSIAIDKIIIDPGIGFGKTAEQNIEIIRKLPRFKLLGCPLMIGTSRKSFIGKIFDNLPTEDRLIGSVVSAVASALNGASILRVHDVFETKQAMEIINLIYGSN